MNYYAYPGTISRKHIPAQLTHEIRVQWAQQIIKTVAVFYNVRVEDMQGKRRTTDLVRACQVSTYLIRIKITDLSLKQVSALFGSRYLGANGHDHSCIVHNFAKVNNYISIGDGIAKDIEQLLKLI
jgi:chromosomal replication initiator protein